VEQGCEERGVVGIAKREEKGMIYPPYGFWDRDQLLKGCYHILILTEIYVEVGLLKSHLVR